ncbi:Putative ribosome biogenesis GTPase RsgA [Vibrio aerogenes CECT 7868]|uniref:Small ribosomal subunit biogenesis GTPase RsgA n=1 Tax=Vibrio aerogenes CECT 7868 TaxID=1216006 RepID=A0A1M5ZW96_9VIBR|nr:ribosome small subunit-dependent GTPase A [Vibrio aerogenes]SHI28436.1 Putative ribosome biogenesis GTPase RsgA [Vibrio aerogenes CECT 7868]
MNSTWSLSQLGWQPVFQQQLTLDDYDHYTIARISEHHRSQYILLSETGKSTLQIHHSYPAMTVGDWVLIDSEQRFVRLLDRASLFSRKAAGSKVSEQYIAANVDTLFIVCALNQDFNLSRIERYLALAQEARVEPVVILTKRDLCQDGAEKRAAVQALDPMLMIEMVNALDIADSPVLNRWCKPGKTVAFMGSSGVGKSTLINMLMGQTEQLTGGIREDDGKGRHTTTSRSLHFTPDGGVVIDTPGMRELQLADCATGVQAAFADIDILSQQCRFSDCQHHEEPGCAVRQALNAGTLDQRRLSNYFKLRTEQQRNAASLKEKRDKAKQFTRMCRNYQNHSRKEKKGY